MVSSQTWGRCFALFLLAGTTLVLASCGNGADLSRTFGLTRDAPDEFAVTTRAPLSMPPDFTLRPPEPGAPRPMEQSERTQAQEALVPQTALGTAQAGESPGQEALIQAAGPPAPPNIRQRIDSDARMVATDNGFLNKLLFWKQPQPHGIVVDPVKEAKRLREDAALGQSPEVGDTPIIQPQRKGWLEGIF